MVLAIVVIAVRRSVLIRSGAIDVCWRRKLQLRTAAAGYSARADSGTTNSCCTGRSRLCRARPGRLHRGSLKLGDRRPPVGTEPDLLPVDAVIVRCTDGGTQIELALSEEALTGLRSWLESLPPATRSVRLFHRGVKKT